MNEFRGFGICHDMKKWLSLCSSCLLCVLCVPLWSGAQALPYQAKGMNLGVVTCANSLYPTNEPVAEAKLCLSCHFGNADKFVTHRMMGAGHPRMSFELDTFSQTQPPHFVVDADWYERKGVYDGVRVWAVGQALAAAELIDVLLDPTRRR